MLLAPIRDGFSAGRMAFAGHDPLPKVRPRPGRRTWLKQMLLEVNGDKEAAQLRLAAAESKRQEIDNMLKEAETELKAGLGTYRAEE